MSETPTPNQKAGKLTGPQYALLRELIEDGPRFVSDTYPPRNRLLALGLIEVTGARYGGNVTAATPAGRTALETQGEDKKP